MPRFEKHYTLDEANFALPGIRPLLIELQRLHRELAGRWHEADEAVAAAPHNGGSARASATLDMAHKYTAIHQALTEEGIQVRDSERGLIDFPSFRDGDEVFLCYHLGEEQISTWHPLDEGFQGRRPC
jgi:hypothetical protein